MLFFFLKQKTAYEMRISDWSSDVCSSDLHAIYGKDVVAERHRHRYEFNNRYRSQLEEAGLVISAKSMDDLLVEMVELPNHPWFIACQAHPEFLSTPRPGHPLLIGFVPAARSERPGGQLRMEPAERAHTKGYAKPDKTPNP